MRFGVSTMRFLIAAAVFIVLGAAIELLLLLKRPEPESTRWTSPAATSSVGQEPNPPRDTKSQPSAPTETPSADATPRRSAEAIDSKTGDLRVRVVDDADRPVGGASIWVIRAQAHEFPSKRDIDSVRLCDE